MPLCYNYDGKDTFEFYGSEDQIASPLETDVYLLPADATLVEPPTTGANQVAIFDPEAETWSIDDDFRGTEVWNTTTKLPRVIDTIGDTVAEDETTVAFPVDFTDPEYSYYEWTGSAWEVNDTTKDDNEWATLRSQRDVKLGKADNVISRHNDETRLVTLTEIGSTTITDSDIDDVIIYKQALRDWPDGFADPYTPGDFPTPPAAAASWL